MPQGIQEEQIGLTMPIVLGTLQSWKDNLAKSFNALV
jgi:hypothetical protein